MFQFNSVMKEATTIPIHDKLSKASSNYVEALHVSVGNQN